MANKRKIINDPVFGFLSLPNELVYDVLQHPYVQRLNRIRQLEPFRSFVGRDASYAGGNQFAAHEGSGYNGA